MTAGGPFYHCGLVSINIDIQNLQNIPGGQDDDGAGVQLHTGADGGHGNRLGGLGGTRRQVAQLVEDVEVRSGHLGQQAGFVHHADSLARVIALGRLSRQHDTVGAVEDSIGDVGHLRTSRPGIVRHGLEHLRGADDRLALDVALGDHHLLGDEDLGSGDLDPQITTGDHDAVGLVEDLVEVVDALLVLDLGNDLDLLALLAQDLTDMADIAAAADEGGEDHIDLVLHAKLQIADILLRQGGEVDVGSRQVDPLAGGDVAVVQALDAQGLVVYDLEYLEGHDAVIHIDELAGGDHLGDVLVVEEPARSWSGPSYTRMGYEDGGSKSLHVLVIAGVGICLVGGDVEHGAFLDGNILIPGSVARADFGALGVEGNGERATFLDFGGFAGMVDDGLVVLVRAVGEVHADDIETSWDSQILMDNLPGFHSAVPLRSALIFSTEFVLGPEQRGRSVFPLIAILGQDIPIVQMMDVRRKFFMGTISVLSLEYHSSFMRLLKWSIEVLAAILDLKYP